MALARARQTISTPTSTGNQTYNFVDVVTGLAFTPKFARFLSANRDNAAIGDADQLGMAGATDATRQWCCAFIQQDAAATTQIVSGRFSDCCINIPQANSTTPLVVGTIVSFGSGSVTINFTTVDASAHPVYMEVYGGDEIVNAYVGILDTGTGTTDLATTAPGFPPGVVMFQTGRNVAAATSAYTITAGSSNFGSGWTDGTNQYAIACSSDDAGAAADDYMIAYDLWCVVALTANGATYFSADIVSLDATGFTIDRITNTASMALQYIALELQNGVKIGDAASPAGTGVQSITGAGFEPQVALLMMNRAPNIGTVSTYSYFAQGAALNVANQHVISGGSTDAADPTTTSAHGTTGKVLAVASNDNASLLSEAGLSSFDSDGFGLDFTTHDGVTTRHYSYLLLQGTPLVVPKGTLTFNGFAPGVTVSSTFSTTVPAGALAATGKVPLTVRPQSIPIPAGVLTATGYAPAPSINTRITPAAGVLAFTGFAPLLVLPRLISVPAGALTFTGKVPTTVLNTIISPAAGVLTATGFAPVVTATAHLTVDVPKGALVLDAFAPTVSFTTNFSEIVPAGALTFNSDAPGVSVGASVVVSPAAGELIATGFEPLVSATAHVTVAIPLGEMTITGYAPTAVATAHLTIEIPAGELIEEGFDPTVSLTGHVIVEVPLGELTETGYAALVTATANVVVEVPLGVLLLQGFEATITGPTDGGDTGASEYVVTLRRRRRTR